MLLEHARTVASLAMADLTVSKTEAISAAESARRALRGLRASMRETQAAAIDTALTVAGAGAAGYARQTYGAADPSQYMILGYDASLIAGGASVLLGLYQGGTTGERLLAFGSGWLAEWAAREGAQIAIDQAAPATQGVRGSAGDYVRAYAGQPAHVMG